VFAKRNLIRSGAKAQALVLDKKVGTFASGGGRTGLKAIVTLGYLGNWANAGDPLSCKYELRVRFEDGSETEISRHVRGVNLAWVPVGSLLPVRYDPADRTRIAIDESALKTQRQAQRDDVKADALARGEQALAATTEAPSSGRGGVEPDLPQVQGVSAAADRRARKQQARANRERQKARKAALLAKLDRQHEQGLLSDEELADRKARILGSG